jgi:hypothetical protein
MSDDPLCPVCAAGRELLDAEEAHRMAPTLDNASRLARARRAVEQAMSECCVVMSEEDTSP